MSRLTQDLTGELADVLVAGVVAGVVADIVQRSTRLRTEAFVITVAMQWLD